MSVRQILVAARAKIADPGDWTKGASARDVCGRPSPVHDYQSVCWCATGAIRFVSPSRLSGSAAIQFLRSETPFDMGVHVFNDAPKTTHAEVLSLFDRAIAALPEDA